MPAPKLESLPNERIMSTDDVKAHCYRAYTSKWPEQVSWYRPHLETSLSLIERAAGKVSASVIDVGKATHFLREALSNDFFDESRKGGTIRTEQRLMHRLR